MEARGFDLSYEGPQDLTNRLMQDYERNAQFVPLLKLKEK
jgi:hypothetical protein